MAKTGTNRRKNRQKYADNLKRELPRIPFAPNFFAFAKTGMTQLEFVETPGRGRDGSETPLGFGFSIRLVTQGAP